MLPTQAEVDDILFFHGEEQTSHSEFALASMRACPSGAAGVAEQVIRFRDLKEGPMRRYCVRFADSKKVVWSGYARSAADAFEKAPLQVRYELEVMVFEADTANGWALAMPSLSSLSLDPSA